MQIFSNLNQGIAYARNFLKQYGELITNESWQGIKKPTTMFEVDNVYFRACMPSTKIALQESVKPDLPWAEDHFLERISGKPLNPGEQYRNWPGYKDKEFNDRNFRNNREKFTHTYMERYWPKYAGEAWENTGSIQKAEEKFGNHLGIRFTYGDLADVIELLSKEPYTRQAYLPVWFPEDTGVKHGGRVPCSIGYHFRIKGGELHIHYTLRACDYIRHFRNDIYLTVRLCQWVIEKLQNSGETFKNLTTGILTMDIIHFHVFGQERNII